MEPEIGAVYTVQGRPQRYRGGDPDLAASWEPVGAPSAQAPAQPTAEEAALARTNARGGNALTDFLAMARHGATFGFDDEIAGLVAGPQARDEIRQRVADRRLLNPGASALSEIAGGVAVPVGAGATSVKGGRGLLSAGVRGAAVGGAQGALYGLGEGEGSLTERAPGAVKPGLMGAAIGGAVAMLPGLLNAATHRAPGRGERVADALVEETGLPDDYLGLLRGARKARQSVSDSLFGPIDDAGPLIPGRMTAEALQSGGVPVRPRTLRQLQSTQRLLGKNNAAAADELKTAMNAEIGGLRDANKAYAPAAQEFDAIKLGRRTYKTADDIKDAMDGMSPAAARNFAAAQLHDIVAKLRSREDEAVGMLRNFLDAGSETQDRVRQLFLGDEAAFQRFVDAARREQSAVKVIAQLPRVAMLAALGGGGYVGTRWNSR